MLNRPRCGRITRRRALADRFAAWIAQFGQRGRQALAEPALSTSAEPDDLLPALGGKPFSLGQGDPAQGRCA
jgi:hypothetical protein